MNDKSCLQATRSAMKSTAVDLVGKCRAQRWTWLSHLTRAQCSPDRNLALKEMYWILEPHPQYHRRHQLTYHPMHHVIRSRQLSYRIQCVPRQTAQTTECTLILNKQNNHILYLRALNLRSHPPKSFEVPGEYPPLFSVQLEIAKTLE